MTFLFVTLAYYSARNKKTAEAQDFGETAYNKGEQSQLTDPSESVTASTTLSTIYDSKISLSETTA